METEISYRAESKIFVLVSRESFSLSLSLSSFLRALYFVHPPLFHSLTLNHLLRGSNDQTPVRLQLVDKAETDTVVSETLIDIREMLMDTYLCPVSPAPTLGLFEGMLGDPDRSRWIRMRNLSSEEQKQSQVGIFPSIKTLMNPRECPPHDACPIFGTFCRISCKLIPDIENGGIRIGAHHQGFGRAPPNCSPHLKPPKRVKDVDVAKLRSKRPSFVSTPYHTHCRLDNFSSSPKRDSRKFDFSDTYHIPMPVEVRLVVWRVKGLDTLAKRVGAPDVPAIYLASHIGHGALQKTDISWNTVRKGETEMNWRMCFPLEVNSSFDDFRFQLVLDAIPVLNSDKNSNEMRFWSMSLQPAGIIESMRVKAGVVCPMLNQVKSFGTCTLDLKKRLKNMRTEFDRIQKNRHEGTT